jgi:hypothetical protein
MSSALCIVCELPVSEDDSHVLIVRSGENPERIHERCMSAIRRAVVPWPEPGRAASLSR